VPALTVVARELRRCRQRAGVPGEHIRDAGRHRNAVGHAVVHFHEGTGCRALASLAQKPVRQEMTSVVHPLPRKGHGPDLRGRCERLRDGRQWQRDNGSGDRRGEPETDCATQRDRRLGAFERLVALRDRLVDCLENRSGLRQILDWQHDSGGGLFANQLLHVC
jgi:hypothetical protein